MEPKLNYKGHVTLGMHVLCFFQNIHTKSMINAMLSGYTYVLCDNGMTLLLESWSIAYQIKKQSKNFDKKIPGCISEDSGLRETNFFKKMIIFFKYFFSVWSIFYAYFHVLNKYVTVVDVFIY